MKTEIQSISEYVSNQFPQLAQPLFLEELSSVSSLRYASNGEVIIDYGSYIKFVPLVVKGQVKILRENENGREILLYFLSGGDTCAASFSCCLLHKRSEIKAIAVEETEFVAIPLNEADKWMATFPVWRNFILTMYDSKLYQMIDTIDRLAFSKLDEQLLDYLENRTLGLEDRTLEITHQQIAQDLNASREAISRLLKKMEDQKLVKLGRNMITMLTY